MGLGGRQYVPCVVLEGIVYSSWTMIVMCQRRTRNGLLLTRIKSGLIRNLVFAQVEVG